MKRSLSQFTRLGADRGGAQILIWVWDVAPTLAFFVYLQPFEQSDEFTIEIAWSDDGRFPYNAPHNDSEAIEQLRYRRRLPFLFCRTAREKMWKVELAETEEERHQRLHRLLRGDVDEWLREPSLDQLVERAKELADDAFQKVLEYGMPLFSGVIQHRQLQLPAQSTEGSG